MKTLIYGAGPKRQPFIFNLYYWLPRFLEPTVLKKLFASKESSIRFGLHAKTVGPELRELAAEFEALKREAGLQTPTLDELLAAIPAQAQA